MSGMVTKAIEYEAMSGWFLGAARISWESHCVLESSRCLCVLTMLSGYIPLKTCQRKGCKKQCKHGFPKEGLLLRKTVLVCRGVAKRLAKAGLRATGRRNALGSFLGKRSDAWQSGTMPAFAAAFRSNTHTAPNMRMPPMPGTHNDTICRSKRCHSEMEEAQGTVLGAYVATAPSGSHCLSV